MTMIVTVKSKERKTCSLEIHSQWRVSDLSFNFPNLIHTHFLNPPVPAPGHLMVRVCGTAQCADNLKHILSSSEGWKYFLLASSEC